jgi:hypothetical protein
MSRFAAGGMLIVFMLVFVGPATSVLGSDSQETPDSSTQILRTVREVHGYLFNSKGEVSVSELARWSGARPERVRAGIYHWRFADGKLITTITNTPAGEVIECWGRLN